jgi:hypothetical protein
MPGDPKTTIYANIVNLRVTPNEFVFEFGAHFPDAPNQAPPSDYRPEVRVVLPRAALGGLANILNQTLAQAQPGIGGPTKPTPGFQAPGIMGKDKK